MNAHGFVEHGVILPRGSRWTITDAGRDEVRAAGCDWNPVCPCTVTAVAQLPNGHAITVCAHHATAARLAGDKVVTL